MCYYFLICQLRVPGTALAARLPFPDQGRKGIFQATARVAQILPPQGEGVGLLVARALLRPPRRLKGHISSLWDGQKSHSQNRLGRAVAVAGGRATGAVQQTAAGGGQPLRSSGCGAEASFAGKIVYSTSCRRACLPPLHM